MLTGEAVALVFVRLEIVWRLLRFSAGTAQAGACATILTEKQTTPTSHDLNGRDSIFLR
jgi:hypothetical protein